jgi:hypothetical protein
MDKVYVVIHEDDYEQTAYVTDWTAESTKDWKWEDFLSALKKLNPNFEFDEDEDYLLLHPDCPIHHTGE